MERLTRRLPPRGPTSPWLGATVLAARRLALYLVFPVASWALGCGTPAGVMAPPRQPADRAFDTPEALEVADAASDSQPLGSRVTEVTVYSDRARITRRATAELSTEPRVFAFRQLPGWVDDSSVRVAVSAGTILDVRVDRDFLAKSSDESWQRAEAEHKALSEKVGELNDELAVLGAEEKQIDSMKAFSNEKLSQETIIGDVRVQSYAEVLEFIGSSLRSIAKARRAVNRQLGEILPEQEASKRRLDSMRNMMELEETTVLVTLEADRSAPAELELTYMLPGATWEPVHELRASTSDPRSVDIVSFAEVTQTTGEDWTGAELSFSTQSATESVRIPELEALTLGDTHTATEILTTSASSFSRAQKAFEEQNFRWNAYQQGRAARRARERFEQVYQSNMEYFQVVQAKTVQIFESLQKRGTTVHFRAQGPTSVRGDGHPARVPIGRSTLASTQKIVAAPEQSLNAAHTVALVNATGQPLLPGKVALYRDGAFLGMTAADFIAEDEGFSMFLGVADHLKLSRELDHKLSSLVRGRRNRMKVAFKVTVENLSSEPVVLTLADRIPVSENREIVVDQVKISPAARPDSRGILSWELSLAAREKQQLSISYQVDYPSELIIETRRRRAMAQPSGGAPQASPAAPAARMDFDERAIEDQISNLEEAF